MTHTITNRPLALEDVERLIYRNGDDMAVSIARSFERLEEQMGAMESRLLERLGDLQIRNGRK